MKLSGFNKVLIPIAISGLSINTNPEIHTFMYNQADEIQNEFTNQYLDKFQTNNYVDLLSKIKFNEHYNSWIAETMFSSSPSRIINNMHLKEIINIGSPAIKLIAEKLEEKPSYLVWALNILYGFKISKDSTTTISQASRLWLKYLRNQHLI